MAAARSTGSGRKSGRSTGSIVDVHSGSVVPLTMSRFSAISAVRRVPSAVTSACRCCAACDCACTTSIGAIVPISTFVWLFRSSSSASSSDCRATSTDCTANT